MMQSLQKVLLAKPAIVDVLLKFDGFVKSPSAALRFTFVVAAYPGSTLHSSGFARLASGSFYETIVLVTFCEVIKFGIMQNTVDFGQNLKACVDYQAVFLSPSQQLKWHTSPQYAGDQNICIHHSSELHLRLS